MKSDSSLMRKDVAGWALYDFANTIYSMNIVSRYLKLYIVDDLGYDDRYFDIPFSISMLLAALLLPALGAMSDHSTKKKIFLLLFTLTCCLSVGAMALVPAALIGITVALFIVANFSYEAAQPFYNALLYSVTDGKKARLLSGVGVALGYVGAALGIMLVRPFVDGSFLSFQIDGMDGWGKVGSFIPTAFLFALFTVPFLLWVRERPAAVEKKTSIRESYRDVKNAIVESRKYPGVLRFLVADYFFEDAVATVIINIGLYCTIVIGLTSADIDMFLIISTVSAVLGSFAMGWIARHWQLKPLLNLIICGWVIVLVTFILTDSMPVIWVLGSLVGVLLGGLWTVSRPLLAELVPRQELGKFFGLFSLSGKAAAIVGPLIWTTVVYTFNAERPIGRLAVDLFGMTQSDHAALPYKAGLASLVVMMVVGLIIFAKVPHAGRVSDA